jgi:HEAT repeat protein
MPLVRKPPAPVKLPTVDAALAFEALEKGTDDERWAAARVVPELPGGVAALGRALGSENDKRVREAILTSLARAGSGESVEALLPFLRSDEAHLRTGALDALSAMKGAVGPYLSGLLRDEDADVRLLACELARNLPEDAAERLLCALLDKESEANVCAAALEVLAEVGGPEALPALARCAERFRDTPFLDFSIKVTADRIRLQSAGPRE